MTFMSEASTGLSHRLHGRQQPLHRRVGLHRRRQRPTSRVFARPSRSMVAEEVCRQWPPYYTWRGKSQFTAMLTKLASSTSAAALPPAACGKIESSGGTSCRWPLAGAGVELRGGAGEAQRLHQHYNFKRPHQDRELIPADRFFRVDGQIKKLIRQDEGGGQKPAGSYSRDLSHRQHRRQGCAWWPRTRGFPSGCRREE